MGKAIGKASALLRALVVLGLLCLAVLVAAGRVDHNLAADVVTLVLAAVVVSVLTPTFMTRLTKLQIGPLALETVSQVTRGADQAVARGQPDDNIVNNLFDLRVLLEAKLAYIAKHLIVEDGRPTFVTVGSLKYDGYLTEEEARGAYGILSLSEETLALLSERQQKTVLEEGRALVTNLRASVFFGSVKVKVSELKWDVSEIRRRRRVRPDLLAEKEGHEPVILVPVFEPSHGLLTTAEEHLAKIKYPERESGRWIVVPNTASEAIIHTGDRIVRVKDLSRALGRTQAATDGY